MCIKGPESWSIAESITPQLVVNQSKINPQLLDLFTTPGASSGFQPNQGKNTKC